jgi:hypothetical protein
MDPPRRKRHPQPDGRTAASLRARDTAPPSPAPPDEPLPDDPLDLEASAPCNPQPVTCSPQPVTCPKRVIPQAYYPATPNKSIDIHQPAPQGGYPRGPSGSQR